MPTAGVIILQVNIFVKYFLSEIQSFLSTENCGDMDKAFASQTTDQQRKKEYLSIFLEIAETGFEPATSGL